jgi:dolichyl-phosphate-mannose-protein mannosyltransferase
VIGPAQVRSQSLHAEEALSRTEAAFLGLICGATLVLRVVYCFHHEIDSDEPQHLHVAWGWSQGLLQYRDLFDNHAPLFHLLTAPLVALIGPTPDIFFYMRLAVLPLYLATLWGTYAIGRILFGKRVGLWAATLSGLAPVFFFKSLEYRTDDLWMCLWVLALFVLLDGEWSWKRSLAAGLLLGTAMGTSLKTVLLVTALGMSAATLPFAMRHEWRSRPRHRLTFRLVALLAGMFVLPLSLIAFFFDMGDLKPFFYGTVLHNCLPGLDRWSHHPAQATFFVPASLLAFAGVHWIGRMSVPEGGKRIRFVLLALTAALYMAALQTFWPIFTTEDLLPFYPLLSIATTGLVVTGARPRPPLHGAQRWRPPVVWLLAAIVLLELGLTIEQEPPWIDGTRPERRLLTEVLQLTKPSDFVLDLKGEAVFRRRPTYYVMEMVTRWRIRRGILPDRIPEEVLATRTCVVAGEIDQFPERTRQFLGENYLPVGQVRVAGRFLPAPTAGSNKQITFEVTIPAEYAIVAENGAISGFLDDKPYMAPRFLDAGPHRFTASPERGRLALVWARAVEKGFSPFRVFG